MSESTVASVQRRTAPPRLQVLASLLQRKCACGQHTRGGECDECRKQKDGISGGYNSLQRSPSAPTNPPVAPPIVGEVLSTPGHPLASETRKFLEPRLGREFSQMRITAARAMAYAGDLAINEPNDSFEREADKTADAVMRDSSNSETEANRVASFEDVRIHTDAKSTESSRAVNALAYTVGNHVVFAEGQYAPSEPRGLRLLAHELTHVMQLGRTQSASQAQVRRQAAPPAAGSPAPAPAMPLSDAMLRQIAQRLRKAMEGWGTDEEAIYSSLSGRTQAEVDEIAKVYQREYKRSLIDDLKDELSDSELKHLAIFAPNAVEKFGSTPQQQQASRAEIVARQLQKAMEGWGTDE